MTIEPATLFLLGAWLVPLALVSGISAWADNRKPWVAAGLALAAAGLIGWANIQGGPFGPRDIPDLTLRIIVQLRAALF